ncbi:unnamed protein product [Mucor hiemalis]
MDVSDLCINLEDGAQSSLSESRISLPPMAEIHNNNAHNDNRNIIIYPKNGSIEYQQRYQLQHQHLKSYTFANSSTPSLPSIPIQQQTNEYFYQPNNNNNNNNNNNTSSLPPFSGISSLPSLSSTSTATEINSNSNSIIIKQLLEQCNTIYTRVGKYRVDPLTESERSNIIDQVYFTAEIMLRSLKQLHSDENQLITPPIQSSSSSEVVELQQDVKQDNNNTQCGEQSSNTNQVVEDLDEYKIIRQARNLQDSTVRPKYRRRSKRNVIGQRCHSCNTTETPEWRRGPDGARTLCNACGLHYSKLLRKGSMTVQTHNYLLEGAPNYEKAPIIIQYPIIQVNTNSESSTAAASLPAPAPAPQTQQPQQRSFIRPPSHSFSSGSNVSRITEIPSDEEMIDSDYTNKREGAG